jgi:hypothetical protein
MLLIFLLQLEKGQKCPETAHGPLTGQSISTYIILMFERQYS